MDGFLTMPIKGANLGAISEVWSILKDLRLPELQGDGGWSGEIGVGSI